MKLAIIGTRGIPANYGGFETVAEELAAGLTARGHEVVVYCRPSNDLRRPTEWNGAKLIYRPVIETKALSTLSHSFLCLLHAVRHDYDTFMLCNAGNGPLCLIPKLTGQKFAINVDGLEWKRAKWGRFAKLYYQFGEWCSARMGTRVVSDSHAIQAYYTERFKVPSSFVTNGAHVEDGRDPAILKRYGLEPDEYFFVGSRLEPENNADLTVEAFHRVRTEKKLAIAGGANWKSPFVERMNRTTDPRVKMLGAIYEPGHMRELHAHCYAYVHGNEVGGTNPALLKALGYGNCVLALDAPFNAEVVQDAGILYRKDPADLAEKMQRLVDDPQLTASYRPKGPQRIHEAYEWPMVVDGFERLFERLANGYYDVYRPAD